MGVSSKWTRAFWEAYREPHEPPDLDSIAPVSPIGRPAEPVVDPEPTAHQPNPWKQAGDRAFAAHGFTGHRPTIREWAAHKNTCQECQR